MDLRESLQPSRLELLITGINGVLGESLEENNSIWAVQMGFYHRNRRLALDRECLAGMSPYPSPRIAVFVHGLGSHEQLWAYPRAASVSPRRVSYGSLLLEDCGYTPLYLRFNSGLRISYNGRALSSLLAQLVGAYPVPIEQIILVGHSLGGLLIRSACHYGGLTGQDWVAKVGRVFYLGAPHFGTPWENFATDRWMRHLARSGYPLARKLSQLYEARGAAIRDLRYPHLVDEDWNRNGEPAVTRVPWASHIAHHFISSTITHDRHHPLARVVGDGMVPLYSAQGIASDKQRTAEYAHIERYSAVLGGVSHLRLAHAPPVYQLIKQWLEGRQGLGRSST